MRKPWRPVRENLGRVEYDERSWHYLNPPVDERYAEVFLFDFSPSSELLETAYSVVQRMRYCPVERRRRKTVMTDDELLRISGTPTVEYPIRVILEGKYIYERYFATREEALEVVEILMAGQPLDHERDVAPFGFTHF